MDYAGFVARMRSFQATDEDDAEFTAAIPGMLRDAELRAWRDLDPLAARASAQLAYVPGSPSVALPADAWIARRLVLTAPVASAQGSMQVPGQQGAPAASSAAFGRRSVLAQRQPSFLEAYWPVAAATGAPKYWAQAQDGALLLAPTPGPGFTLALDYVRQAPSLSPVNPSTWLSVHHPDLLCHAAMVWLSGWTKNYGVGDDPSGAPFWEAQYQAALAGARLEEGRKRGEPQIEPSPSPAPLRAPA